MYTETEKTFTRKPTEPSSMDTADHDGDEIIVEWCRKGDCFSDKVVYEGDKCTNGARQHASESPYVQLDPLTEVTSWKIIVDGAATSHGGEKPVIPKKDVLMGSYDLTKSIASLRRNGYLLLTMILSILCYEKEFKRQCVPDVDVEHPVIPTRHTRPERMHRRNLEELAACDFMVPLIPKGLTGTAKMRHEEMYGIIRYCSLFTLPKASRLERVILNGKPGNALLVSPPYFSFFSPETIVRILRSLGCFTGFTLDIRHCFYRLKMHRAMRRYYGIARGKDGIWVPTVLPMGSTFGPALGQVSTLAMIAFREKDDPVLGLRVPEGGIPSVLTIVDDSECVIGYIMVCIDNIAVICTDQKVTNAWYARLQRNAKELGVWPFKKEERTHWSEACFEFIGLHYEKGQWWHCSDRIERWRRRYGERPSEAEPGLKHPMNADMLQSLTGVLVWDRRLRIQGMQEMRVLFGIQRRALRSVNPQLPTREEEAYITERWHLFLRNEPQVWSDDVWPPPWTGKEIVTLVTDASDERWSWLEMRNGMVITDERGLNINPNDTFPGDIAKLTIYYKELYAVLLALRALAESGRRDVDIALVGDSQAVIGSLLKRMSPEAAWVMIDEIIELIVTNGWGINLKWVESDGNVAHSATHMETITAYRTTRSWAVATCSTYPQPDGGTGKRNREGKLVKGNGTVIIAN